MLDLRAMSIQRRLFVLTTVALAPALAILLYYLVTFHQQRVREVDGLALRYGQLASLEMERIVSGAESVLRTIASAPVVREPDDAACTRFLDDVTAQLPQFVVLEVTDARGLRQCGADLPGTPLTVADRPYFIQAMTSDDLVVGQYTRLTDSGKASLPLAFPIRDGAGTTIGVVVAKIDLDWLGARLRERSLPEGGALTIADRNGVIIGREPFPERFVGTKIPEAFMPLVRASEPGTMAVLSQDGTRRVIGYFPAGADPSGLYVSAGISTVAALAPIYRATWRGLGIAALGAFVAYLAAWLIGRRLFQAPLRRMLETVDGWRGGDERRRTGMKDGPGEIEAVGAAIDRFMDELLAGRAARLRAEQHRDLLARELNHRVKNSLATVQVVAKQTFRDPSDRDSLRAFVDRLASMARVNDLLISQDWLSADIAETVRSAIAPFEDADQPQFALTGPSLAIRARVALALSMALHELCTNAAKYGALTADAGAVAIDWRIEAGAGDPVFTLVWTERGGPPVKAPETAGFGFRMIRQALTAEIGGDVEIDFAAAGLVCRITAPADRVEADAVEPDAPRLAS